MQPIKDISAFPQVLCVLNPDDAYFLKEESKNPDLADIDARSICTPYDIRRLKEQGADFSDVTIKENVIFSRTYEAGHPIKYIFRTPENEIKSVRDRGHYIELIVSYLGGIDFKWKESSVKDIHGNLVIEAKKEAFVKAPLGGKGTDKKTIDAQAQDETKVEADIKVGLKRELENTALFNGVYTKEGYEEAKRIAEETGLIESADIKVLLDERGPNHPNAVIEKSFKVDVLTNIQTRFEFLKNTKAGVGKLLGAKMDVNVDAAFDFNSAHSVEFEATFGPVQQDISLQQDIPCIQGKWKKPLLIILAGILGVGGIVLLTLLFAGVL